MRADRLLVAVLFSAVGAACGGSSNPPSSPPGSGGSETIAGTERIGWNQRASNLAQLGTFNYRIYVDGVGNEAPDPRCDQSAGSDGFACSSRLPPMSNGTHTLQVGTYSRETGLESTRSAPLQVTVRASGAPSDDAQQKPLAMTTSEGVTLVRTDIVAGLDDPSDMAFATDSRLFIAERAGRIRIVTGTGLPPDPALVLDDAVTVNGAGGLLALALDPDFVRTRYVYLLHIAESSDGPAFRVSRYREAGGVLGERAVLFDRQPGSAIGPTGTLRFGADGKLYVLLDDGGDPDAAARAAVFNGKLLRLNADGTTPDDAPAANPVAAAGFTRPGGLDWQPGTRKTWTLDRLPALSRLQSWRGSGRGTAVKLPEAAGGSMAFYDGAIAALRGSLLVASPYRRELMRVRFDPADAETITNVETLLEAVDVRAVAEGPDGRVYVATRSEVWAFGR